MTDEVRRARPGFISDAEDMLHDFDEIDRLNEGKLTPGKIVPSSAPLDMAGLWHRRNGWPKITACQLKTASDCLLRLNDFLSDLLQGIPSRREPDVEIAMRLR